MEKKIRRKLRNIRPFDEYLFKSCFFHQLLACYPHFGADENVLLLNYLPCYAGEGPELRLADAAVLGERELEAQTGLRLVRKSSAGDFTMEAISSIDAGAPVIVGVDSYCLSYRHDLAGKWHDPHFLLLYGYDLPSREFVANEHMFLRSMRYGEQALPFSIVSRAHRSYCDRLSACGAGIVKVKKVGDTSARIRPADYAARYRALGGALEASLESLSGALRAWTELTEDAQSFLARSDALLLFFESLRCRKTSEVRQLRTVYGDASLDAAAGRILELSILLYGTTCRIRAAGGFGNGLDARFRQFAQELWSLEERVHRHIMDGGAKASGASVGP